MKKILSALVLVLLSFTGIQAGNPLLPGYFADPTVLKIGDTYYIYATGDGIKLASGQPQVWISKDFVNWYNYKLDIRLPEGLNNNWAPDVVPGRDGKYYYYMGNCERGCNIYGYVSDSPMGPFTPTNNGRPVIPAGVPKNGFPSLDAQMLLDDDGSLYSYFGTWCSSFGGIGFAKIDPNNMHSLLSTSMIPMSEVPKAFEASYPMKRNGKYFLMYSSGDCRLSSYAVHYSVSDKPEGPFTPGKNNPILSTTADGSVDGPGHHSVLKEGNEYYIVYHRHDNPHSTNGEFRQVCIDKMVFSDSTTIEKVVPNSGGPFFTDRNPANIALNTAVTASSAYHLVSKPTPYGKSGYDYVYKAENAVDNDNGTLWKAASSQLPQSLTVDLGQTKELKRIATEFEYPTFYYQYKLEVSADGKNWTLYSDKTANRRAGCPMLDDKAASARYIRLTITGTEKTGALPAVWNIKAYDQLFETPAFVNPESATGPAEPSSNSLLVDFKASKLKAGNCLQVANKGKLGGTFHIEGQATVSKVDGIQAVNFDGKSFFKLDKPAPTSLNWNAPYTAAVWVYNPTVEMGECLLAWNTRDNMLQGTYAALMYGTGNYGAVAHGDGAVDVHYKGVPEKGRWHHIVVTFDGALENVYVDGKLNTQLPLSLYVERGDVLVGSTGADWENFSGSIAEARLYGKALTADEVVMLMQASKPKK
jgi:hypothetical protein